MRARILLLSLTPLFAAVDGTVVNKTRASRSPASRSA